MVATRPSVLFLTDIVPSPRATNAGGKMFAYYARELSARGWSVNTLALGAPHELAWAHDLDEWADWSRVLPIRRSLAHRVWRAAQQLVRAPEYALVRESGVERVLFERLRSHPVDIVHALHPWLIGAARRAIDQLPLERRPALVGHIMDIVAVQALDQVQHRTSAWLRPLRLLAFARWAWREFADYAQAGVWLAHTQTDLEVVRLLSPHTRPAVHSPIWFDGVEYLEAQPCLERAASDYFLYVGSIADPRMKMAISWLVEHALPKLQCAERRLKLYIVGAAANQAPDWGKSPCVVFCNAVTDQGDLLALYDNAFALAFPLQGGRYSRHVKVLTAFARGCPVVMTTHANWTLGARHGEEAWVADTPEGFVEGLSRLRSEPVLAHRLAEGGYARLRLEYPDSGVVIRTVEQAYGLTMRRIR